MDPRLLKYYNRELEHVRTMGAEFAEQYPKIASRLRLEGLECADPYVERLLEGFAFLAARVQLKLDAEFPRFTQHLLEMVYPQYLAPTPAAALVQIEPDLSEGSLADGFLLPRHTSLRAAMVADDLTPCEFRTAHDLTLWPLRLTAAEYIVNLGEFAHLAIPGARRPVAGIRLRLQTTAGCAFSDLALDRLPLFLTGPQSLPMRLYELILARTVAVVVQPGETPAPWHDIIERAPVRQFGFEDHQALLPPDRRTFQGYRLLQEYFMLPQRFMFLEFVDLGRAVRRCKGQELELIVLLSEADAQLKTAVEPSLFQLFTVPAINLFPRRTDRIHLDERHEEHLVIPDRTRPLDFEVHTIESVAGYGAQNEHVSDFRPFYSPGRSLDQETGSAFYTVHRTPRLQPSRARAQEARSRYVGSEVSVSLVDREQRPARTGLRQLALKTLCTNRDLSLFMATGRGNGDFTLQTSAPVQAIRCLMGPTRPRPPFPEGEAAWRLVSHLNLNYLSLTDHDQESGAVALRELLALYGHVGEAAVRKQIDGVRSVSSRSVSRLLTGDGPSVFGRGIEVSLVLDDDAFEGLGGFLLGAVLDRFFARYTAINSFTETVVHTVDRGEVIRWPLRLGRRHVI